MLAAGRPGKLGAWSDHADARYAMGWYVGGPWSEPAQLHPGRAPDSSALIVMFPRRDLAVVTLTNAANELSVPGYPASVDRVERNAVDALIGDPIDTGTSLHRYYLYFDLIALSLLAAVAWSLVRAVRALRTRTRPRHRWLAVAGVVTRAAGGVLLVALPALAFGWRASFLWQPDVFTVIVLIGALLLVTAALRLARLVRRSPGHPTGRTGVRHGAGRECPRRPRWSPDDRTGSPRSGMTRTAARKWVGAGAVGAFVVYAVVLRPRIEWLGTSDEERTATYPGDDLIPSGRRYGAMATTIAAPPERVWPWLVQMGCDRAGFYSFDRLDNGGRPSADRIEPHWQNLREGDRIASAPDASRWFDVALLVPERALVLRASVTVPAARNFDPANGLPRAYSDSTWGFFLQPTVGGHTRLVVTGKARGKPRALVAVANWLFWDPAHWVMQLKQFAGLRRRAESVPYGRAAISATEGAAASGAGLSDESAPDSEAVPA